MLNRSADVVIVGGGIVGASTAYMLGKAGVKCLLLERDAVASHASGFAYGGIGGLGEGTVESPTFPIATEGVRLHRLFAQTLQDETGIDCDYRDRPVLAIAFDQAEADAMRSHLRWQKEQQGYTVRWLDRPELLEAEPRISPDAIGAVRVDGTSDVNALKLAQALVKASEALGSRTERTGVNGLLIEEGRVTGVKTHGGVVPCGAVVLAMGPWSAEAAAWLGVKIPITPLKGQILRLRMVGRPVEFSIGWGKDYATTKPDGLLWTGSTEEHAGFDEAPTAAVRKKIMSSLTRMLPSAKDAALVLQTACLRPVTADGLIVLGKAPGVGGVHIGTGGGRQGIVLGPAMGKALSELVTKGESSLPISPFSPARFARIL